MKKIFAFGFFITSFISLAIFISATGATSVAHADPAGTLDGSACNFNGQGTGSGMMSGGACVATSAYVSQSNPQTGAAPTGASGFTALAPIPGLTDAQTTSVLNGNTLALFFNNLYRYLIGLAATLAVIEIVWAGLDISFFHKDAVSAIVDDKGRIYNAIFGLILVLSPYLVFSIINPSILNLSLNLPKIVLDIPAGGVSSTTPSVVDPKTGCIVSGTTGFLQIATCSAQNDIQAQVTSCTGSDGKAWLNQITNPANGLVTTVVTCSTKKNFIFIDTKSTWFSDINGLRPLVSTPSNPNNGSEAMNFASICQNANLKLQTCISNVASVFNKVSCNLTGANAGTSWKCYNETLTCEPNATLDSTCTSSVDWQPFQ